jgi:hypothetical protein
MTMQRITITAGTGYDRHGEPLQAQDVQTALAGIRATLAGAFGGYTEAETVGGWINGAGELVTEPGRRWVALANITAGDAMKAARAVAEYARDTLRQESVLIERDTIEAEFSAVPVTVTEAESSAAQ